MEYKGQWNAILLDILEELGYSVLLIKKAPFLLEQVSLSCLKKTSQYLILAGPSGVGKGTIGRQLEQAGWQRFVRVTTRPKRPDEIDGVDFDFITLEDFLVRRKRGEFLGKVGGSKTYGTFRAIPRQKVLDSLGTDKRFYIEGSERTPLDFLEDEDPRIQAINPVCIFLLPPSFEELEKRLRKRGSEKEQEIQQRLEIAIDHLRKAKELKFKEKPLVDVYIVNDESLRVVSLIQRIFG